MNKYKYMLTLVLVIMVIPVGMTLTNPEQVLLADPGVQISSPGDHGWDNSLEQYANANITITMVEDGLC